MTNIYNKINISKKPRVHISYEVEDGGSTVKKELPFVVGVIGDLSGDSKKSLKSLKQRKFVNITGENFEQVMNSIAPSVKTRVKNTLKDDGSEIPIELIFKSMEDFSPGKIAENVPALKKLLDIREKLNQIISKTERSEELESALAKLIQDEEGLKEVMTHLNQSNNSEQENKDEDKTEEGEKSEE